MSARLTKIRARWSDSRLKSLPGVPHTSSADSIFKAISDADKSQGNKYVSWALDAWESGKFQWEDIRTGAASKVSDQIMRFDINKNKIPDPAMRSLMKYRGPGELDEAMDKAGVPLEVSDFDLSGKQQKKILMAKARLESTTFTTPQGCRIDIPLTEFASSILGRNTRWCTAAKNDNMFSSYAEDGPLFIITLPTGERFQAHVDTEFLDDNDAGDAGTIDLEHQNTVYTIMTENDVSVSEIEDSPIRKWQDDIAEALSSYINKTLAHKYDDTLREAMIRDITYKKPEKVIVKEPLLNRNIEIEEVLQKIQSQNFKGISCSIEKPRDDKDPNNILVIRVSQAPRAEEQRFIDYLYDEHSKNDIVMRHSTIIPDASFIKAVLETKHDKQEWKHYITIRAIDLRCSDVTEKQLRDIIYDLCMSGMEDTYNISMLHKLNRKQAIAILNGICDSTKDIYSNGIDNHDNIINKRDFMDKIRNMCGKLYNLDSSIENIIPFALNDKNKNLDNVTAKDFQDIMVSLKSIIQHRDNLEDSDTQKQQIIGLYNRLINAPDTEVNAFIEQYNPSLLCRDDKTKRISYNLLLSDMLSTLSFADKKDIGNAIYRVMHPDIKTLINEFMKPGGIDISDIQRFSKNLELAKLIIEPLPPGELSEHEQIVADIISSDDIEKLGLILNNELVFSRVALDNPNRKVQVFLSQNLPDTPIIQDAIKDLENGKNIQTKTYDILISELKAKREGCEAIIGVMHTLRDSNQNALQSIDKYREGRIVSYMTEVSHIMHSMELSRKMEVTRLQGPERL